MKLAWILWLSSNVLPQPAADSLCLSTTVYLEARDQSVRGQQAVAEVALRRRDSGLWGRNVCEVVTARKQFARIVAWREPAAARVEPGAAWQGEAGERARGHHPDHAAPGRRGCQHASHDR